MYPYNTTNMKLNQNISIRSTKVLIVLATISALLMISVELTKKNTQKPYYAEKYAASQLMLSCMNYLKEVEFPDEINLDPINDPNDTRIVGPRFSIITTGRGSHSAKLSTTNPNSAAMMVEIFKETGLQSGDNLAMCFTGSFPGLNIAAVAAAEVLDLELSIIASVTSSSWGATDPDHTILDMYTEMYDGKLLSSPIMAASIGANQDIGKSLSMRGRQAALNAINRNEIPLINERSLSQNIDLRMELFKSAEENTGNDIDAFINIGGGVASLGSRDNSDELRNGYLNDLSSDEFRSPKGVVYEMHQAGIPIINMKEVERLLYAYNMPIDPYPMPQIGSGGIYYGRSYNLLLVCSSLISLITLISIVILFDQKQNALGTHIIHTT